MNKQSHVTLSSAKSIDTKSVSLRHEQSPQLPSLAEGKTLTARNIVIGKGSVQMEVLVDNKWQSLRLATQQLDLPKEKIASASVQLNQEGKLLNITPAPINVTLNKPVQIQALLNLLTHGNANTVLPMPSELSPKAATLLIKSLQAELSINPSIKALLNNEQPLKAVILPKTQQSFTLDILNKYGNQLHQQPLSQAKLVQILVKMAPTLKLELNSQNQVLINTAQNSAAKAYQAPLANLTTSPLFKQMIPANKPIFMQLTEDKSQLQLTAPMQKVAVALKNSLLDTFNQYTNLQNKAAEKAQLQPSSSVQSPIKSWLQGSFADLKTRISDAVRYFEAKPAMTAINTQKTINSVVTASQTPLTANLGKINLTQMINLANNQAGNTAKSEQLLPTHYNQSPPIAQLFQRIKAGFGVIEQANFAVPSKLIDRSQSPKIETNASEQPTVNLIKSAINDNKNSIVKTLASSPLGTLLQPSSLPRSQLLQPIEAKLLSSILQLPKTSLSIKSSASEPQLRQQVSAQIDKLSQPTNSQNTELNKLVNQAFSRMISTQNMQPSTVQRELLSVLQPSQLSVPVQQSSFTQSIEQLAVTIMAAPTLINAPSSLSFNNQTGIDALLKVLVPNFKSTDSNKLLEQLKQPASQALAAELSQLKTSLAPVQSAPVNQQADSNPLVQFLLPMKLPPEAGQTEVSLGQYKKPAKAEMAEKNVWFVRLNFDYAELGQLQITAEIMDKALDCQLLASSQEVTSLAHPHLEALRHKLTAHGLQVGEMNLSQGAPSHQAFYKSHAIINIKV